MKRVLPLLLAYVFLQTQSWALSGGPNYGSKGFTPVGTYGGVLLDTTTGDAAAGVDFAASTGVFSVGVPQTGVATGSLALFVHGAAYVGSIVASVDPEKQLFQGVVNGTSLFQVVEIVTTGSGNNISTSTVTFSIFAEGNINAKFIQTDTSLTQNAKATRLIGTAQIQTFGHINNDGSPDITSTSTLTVSGLQQSTQVSPSTITL